MTTRVRFGLWSGALVFLAVTLYGTFVYTTTNLFLHASIRNTLSFAADQVVKSLEIEAGSLKLPDQVFQPKATGGERLLVSVLDDRAQPQFVSGQDEAWLPPLASLPPGPLFQTVEPDLSVLTVPIHDGDRLVGAVQVAQSTEPLEQMLQQLLLILAASLPLFVAVSAAGGVFLSRRLLRPIDRMTQTARQFSAHDLSGRLDLPATDDEMGRLAATFDAMLDRVAQAFELQRQFTADASHELRTPVSVMRAILSVTGRKVRTSEEYQRALDDLGASVDRLEALVGALMTLSRTDRSAPLPPDVVDLAELARGAAEALRPLAEEKGLRMVVETAADLRVVGDADALVQVLINVVGNAVHYTETGGLSVVARGEGPQVVVEVRDTGIGIAPDDLPKVFDRFFRADRSRSDGGTGLGLAIAQAIVHRHGGAIEARSKGAHGTTVTITLPRAPNPQGT